MAVFNPSEANLRTYLHVLRRRFPWVIGVTVLSVAISLAIGLKQPKEYSGTAQLLVQPASSDSALISGTQQTISPTDVLTEIQLLTSPPVKAKAASQLGFEPSISASQVGQTNVITVTGTAKTPALAALSANTYAKAFVAEQRTNAINALISGEQQYQDQINTITLAIQNLSASASPSAGAIHLSARQPRSLAQRRRSTAGSRRGGDTRWRRSRLPRHPPHVAELPETH